MNAELFCLQNAADSIGLTIHEKFQEDRRKTVKMYFATKNGASVSPVLDYENLNSFLLGWINCKKHG